MMKYENNTCQVCGENKQVVISSNPLAKQICSRCIADSIDIEKAEEIRNLSMTLRIPFHLNEYYSLLLSSKDKYEAIDRYLSYLSEGPDMLRDHFFKWDEIDKHYNAALTYTKALAEIAPLREAITERGVEKWGHDHTFQQIVKLEQIYESTVRQYNIQSSLQQDAVKKAARLSVKMDDLISSNEFKELRDATVAQASFLKIANIEDLVAAQDDETITTVADLAAYLEKNGFEFNKMLPDIEQDDIDLLMTNYEENVKEIVYNATGIESQFRDFIDNIKKETETRDTEMIAKEMPLDDFQIDEFLEEEERILDRELEAEEVEFDLNDEDLYY